MKFNKTVYVYVDGCGDDSFYIADEKLENCVDGENETRIVGVYSLIKKIKVSKTVKIESVDIK